MSKIQNFVVDRVLRAYMTNSDDELIGYLDQLSDANIEFTSESTDAVDAQGVLIKRFYRARQASFSASNALLNLTLVGISFGEDSVKDASAAKPIAMPKSLLAKKGESPVLKKFVPDSVHVYGLTPGGTITNEYVSGTTASDTEFVIASDGTVTLPTNASEDQYIVYYEKAAEAGQAYIAKADGFPQSCKLFVECIGIDVCKPDDPRLIVVEFPNFQLSPDMTITFDAEQTLDFSGDAAVDYCSVDKTMVEIFAIDDDDIEDEDENP